MWRGRRRTPLLAILAARGLHLDEPARVRILAERDLERLDRWIVGAIACGSVAELLATP